MYVEWLHLWYTKSFSFMSSHLFIFVHNVCTYQCPIWPQHYFPLFFYNVQSIWHYSKLLNSSEVEFCLEWYVWLYLYSFTCSYAVCPVLLDGDAVFLQCVLFDKMSGFHRCMESCMGHLFDSLNQVIYSCGNTMLFWFP